MKRILILIIALTVAAIAGWYYWTASQQLSSEPVAALLPRETIFLAEIPDFNRARDEWQHSDVYQLYREPAVQEFVRKPLGSFPNGGAVSQTFREIERLAPKNAFIALTSIENNNPKLVGGFRFRGSREEAEQIIGRWRSDLMGSHRNFKREKLQYRGHDIEVTKAAAFSLVTAYGGPWFFAATAVPEIQALLDRADRKPQNAHTSLENDEPYRAAVARRPSNSMGFFYLQPKAFSQRLAALRAAVGSTPAPGEGTTLEKTRCIAGSMQFENGKIHDVVFLAMPKLEHNGTLTRSSLSLGTKETFFYLAMLLSLGEKMDTLNQAAIFAGTKILQSLNESGITPADWKAAFGIELGSLADWPASSHWPSLLITLPIIDAAKARRIVDALVRSNGEAAWTQTEKDGVSYFSKQSAASFVAITPTIAVSDRILVGGLNPVSVEEAVKRSMSSGTSELADSPTYKAADRLVPAPTNFFAYVDSAQLYSRLDASLRPMLLMAAAFVPAVSASIDPSKLPNPDVITKHLSPIVSSQRYDGDGYVAESIGPITLDQLGLGIAILSTFGAATRPAAFGVPPIAMPSLPSPSPTP